ncbi:OmpH family outer membrane protein [Janthinobacterium fluminis]|uniref:OmpH family outer membrane protein n=1 Tax=Janthinobacterium fluminis TaxID=2987524 RepID=A0ABT5K6B6_9BURK|nr:OmpH family outer membrane protein [Janthinobacterium fluminis]MDC8759943.1 OmpH family outer membrane protein [Janthinobacterium fluminis]
MKTATATLPKYLAALALCWCSLAPVQAQAQESKIAWLSSERLYHESKLAKLASEKLAEEFKAREKAVQELGARFKVASDKLEKELPGLNESERAKRQREYFELDKELQRRQREFREDLSQRTNEERAAIAEKANAIVQKMALAEGYDVVLQDALWFNPRIDITDRVLKALDK